MTKLMLAYGVASFLVLVLSCVMPARKFELRPRVMLGGILFAGWLNNFLWGATAVTVAQIPVSLFLDIMLYYIASMMFSTRPTAISALLAASAVPNLLFYLATVINSDATPNVSLAIQALTNNLLYIIQLFLVVFLSFEFILAKKLGWKSAQPPTNYFREARARDDHMGSRKQRFR